MTSPRMAGRHVLVSGGSNGIGRAVAVACARQGARVTVIGRDSDAVDATARATGGHGIVAEMTDESAAATAVAEAVDAMGSLDGLVNCVGAATFDSVENTTLDQWDDVIRRNLTSHFLACRAALPHLRRSTAPAIVNVSALAGIVPGVSSAAYSAAKAGVIQFTKTLAAQLAPAVRANSVCPGAVDTQRMRDGFLASKSDDEITAFVGRYACNRLAQPDEIANLIVFLLSSEASYLTGCNYVADGGRSYR